MTSARSSRDSLPRRSKMRKGACLSSGIAALGHEGFDEPERLAFAPVALAEHPVAHLAAAIDDERDGQAARMPCARRVLLRIEQHGQLDVLALHEGLDALRKLAVIHGEDLDGLAAHL